jgi:ArsR family metal-binding transcriptional regulator
MVSRFQTRAVSKVRFGANSLATNVNQFFTCLTSLSSIQFQSRLTSGVPGVFKLLRNVFPSSEVHLVRRLALECRMGHVRIVLLDVERHEFVSVHRPEPFHGRS